MTSKAHAQIILQQNFETEVNPLGWQVSDKAEWGHLIGEDQSNYFRFHPKWRSDKLVTPEIDMLEGFYRLYFSWSENNSGNPDSTTIRFSKDGGSSWQKLKTVGSGSQRNWLKDSAEIGQPLSQNCLISFEYKGSGKFPASYFNLDNISLVKVNSPTPVINHLLDIGIRLYPNPSTGQAFIEIDNKEGKSISIQVIDMQGKVLKDIELGNAKEIKKGIDLVDLSKGNYMVRIRSGDEEKVEKLIIQ